MKKIDAIAKNMKADRLISITCLKKEAGFEIYYHFSKNNSPDIEEAKLEIESKEEVESMIPWYAHAELLESEITEVYGVKFVGNPSSGKRLFLEEK